MHQVNRLHGYAFAPGCTVAANSTGQAAGGSQTTRVSIIIPGAGPRGSGANEEFIRGATRDAKAAGATEILVIGRHQLAQARAVARVEELRKSGNVVIDIYGYSRGAVAGLNVAARFDKLGIDVAHLVTIDPVTIFGSGPLPVPDNVDWARNYWQSGARIGIFDFPGTPIEERLPNVKNMEKPEGIPDSKYTHGNLPKLIFGP